MTFPNPPSNYKANHFVEEIPRGIFPIYGKIWKNEKSPKPPTSWTPYGHQIIGKAEKQKNVCLAMKSTGFFCGSVVPLFFKGPKFGVPKKTPWSLKNCVCFKKVSECKKITLFLCCHVLCWASKLTKLQSRVFVSKTKTTPQRTACYEGSFGKDSTFPYNHMTKYYTVAAITLIPTRLLLFFWAHSTTKIVVQSQKSLKPIPRPLKRVPRRWLHFLAKINGLV